MLLVITSSFVSQLQPIHRQSDDIGISACVIMHHLNCAAISRGIFAFTQSLELILPSAAYSASGCWVFTQTIKIFLSKSFVVSYQHQHYGIFCKKINCVSYFFEIVYLFRGFHDRSHRMIPTREESNYLRIVYLLSSLHQLSCT